MSGAPELTVLSGEPTPEQLAALLTVLAARAGTAIPLLDTGAPVGLDAWRDRRVGLRDTVVPGAGAWRASGLPG